MRCVSGWKGGVGYFFDGRLAGFGRGGGVFIVFVYCYAHGRSFVLLSPMLLALIVKESLLTYLHHVIF